MPQSVKFITKRCSSPKSPSVLVLACGERWAGISRLPFGLQRSGFKVHALCPQGSYLAKTRYLDSLMTYPTLTKSRFRWVEELMLLALLRFQPDWIIPGDEDALMGLQRLARWLGRVPGLGRYACMIRASLANEAFDACLLSKSQFLDRCQQWGIPTPRNVRIDSAAQALALAADWGYPLVLKSDYGWGGAGVTICHNEAELQAALVRDPAIQPGPVSWRSWLRQSLFMVPSTRAMGTSVQQFLSGQVGMVPFCAKDGVLLAANPMLKVKTYPGATGPSSVVQGLNCPAVVAAAAQVVRQTGYTGFGSIDFIWDPATATAKVIEFNPRPVPNSHLDAETSGVDLCLAFYRACRGEPAPAASGKPFTVALFPNEKRRDPHSPHLTTGYHDIPLDDPVLLAALDAAKPA